MPEYAITVSFQITSKEELAKVLAFVSGASTGKPTMDVAPRKRAANGAPPKKDEPPATDPLDVSGGDEAVEDDDDLLGVSQPSLTAEEAWEKGLGILREAMARDKDKCRPLIRAVQKQFGTTKLGEVPPAKGHEVLKAAVEVAEKMGMSV